MSKNTASIATKQTGDTYTAAEFEAFRGFVDAPAQSLGAFTGTSITLDGTGVWTDKTLSANTEITFAESGHEEGNAHLVLITTGGSYTLTFTKPIAYNLYLDSSLTNGGTLASGTYLFSFVFVGGSIKIGYTTMSSVAGDTTAPTITSIVVDADNTGVTVNFSEGCYANNDQTGDLQVADFTAGLSGGTATSPVLSNPVHTAGGSSIDFDLAFTGTADGGETLTITVVDDSVYDQSGNVMASGQNGTDTLNIAYPTWTNTHSMSINNSGFITAADTALAMANGSTDSPFSMECFVKFPTLGAAEHINLLKPSAATGIILGKDNTDRLYIACFSSASDSIAKRSNPISVSTWYHLVATYSGSKTYAGLKIYVNQVEGGSDVGIGSYTQLPDQTSDCVYYIGNSISECLINYSRLYDKVLSLAEVQSLVSGGLPQGVPGGVLGNLLCEYRLNNSPNYSVGNVNGVETPTVSYTTDVPT